MLTIIAVLIFLVLGGIAGLHAYWATGGLWPCRDEASLVRTVVGTKHRSVMPPAWLAWIVSVLILVAALLPLSVTPFLAGVLPPALTYCGLTVLTAIFCARGLLAFSAAFHRRHSAEPFATLDRRIYGPLCLSIGIGYLALLALV
ncbi:MAG TPA: DUF3995 domain-containing protein [Ensifer sp.]|jgi:hypothetical protein|uniref:DUF3995 domain-containing protein n=1 Tax=Ensifer sp. TaxID=1872086 RepID=UPI002E1083E7|nr:DUF3995 domain-containing protein [Ensifer sp.]